MARLSRISINPWLLIIIIVGAALRLFEIDAKTVWLDEAFSIWLARQSLWDLWSWLVKIDQHPPLYYTLLHIWVALFGDLQGVVRTLSALCGIVAMPFFYGATYRLFDKPTALIATLLLAVSPFHVWFSQETRMYALLTLVVAVALFCLAHILTNAERRPQRNLWLAFALAQTAVMLTHNTALVFFPLAINLAVGGAIFWKYWQGGVSSWPALNDPGFDRRWLRSQLVAFACWLPWAIPFVMQAMGVDNEFWIPPPDGERIWLTLHNFNLAFLPGWFPIFPLWDFLYWGLAALGVFALRRTPAQALLLGAGFLLPFVGELLVSLRRPIFYDRTLIWTTLPYYMLIAVGLTHLGRYTWREAKPLRQWGMASGARLAQVVIVSFMVGASLLALSAYYFYFEKEDWAKAAGYVAQNAQPGDMILFNATWVQIPFEYYYRHYNLPTELRGLPVDLFDRGVLEPKMAASDVPYLRELLADRDRVWLVYSHDWYTDPEQIIPRELDSRLRRVEALRFEGLQVLRYEGK